MTASHTGQALAGSTPGLGALIWAKIFNHGQTTLAQAWPEPTAKHVPDLVPGTPSRPCRVIQRFLRHTDAQCRVCAAGKLVCAAAHQELV